MTAAAAQQTRERLLWADLIRAGATLMVVFLHAIQILNPQSLVPPGPLFPL